jgi:hypothetical protein
MGDDLSYREKDVDETLNDHDRRITRLEMAGLVALGWGLAESTQLTDALLSLVL